MNRTDLHTFVNSRAFVWLLSGIGFLIILIAVFQAGVFVGFHRASFANDWQENYERNFGPAPGPFRINGAYAPNPHGAIGQIVRVSLPSIIVADPDNDGDQNERSVTIATSTIIREGMQSVDADSLSVGQYAVVIGEPDASGTVNATFIRIMPPASPEATQGKPISK